MVFKMDVTSPGYAPVDVRLEFASTFVYTERVNLLRRYSTPDTVVSFKCFALILTKYQLEGNDNTQSSYPDLEKALKL